MNIDTQSTQQSAQQTNNDARSKDTRDTDIRNAVVTLPDTPRLHLVGDEHSRPEGHHATVTLDIDAIVVDESGLSAGTGENRQNGNGVVGAGQAQNEFDCLVHSIKAVGLLHPLIVRPDNSLVAGRRRLAACRKLGWAHIPVTVVGSDELIAEIAGIDEDIERKNLPLLDRCEMIVRRKELYGGLVSGSEFNRALARRMGVSPRSVEQELEIISKIPQDVRDALRVMPLGNKKTALLKLKQHDPVEQRALVPFITASTKKLSEAQQKLRRARVNESAPPPTEKNDDIQVWLGDFREKAQDIADESCDLILTDLPYPREYLPLWADLSDVAARVLKPGAFLITYSGQMYLPEVMHGLGKSLDFFWLAGLQHAANHSACYPYRCVTNVMKPILIYNKPPISNPPSPGRPECFSDLITSSNADKRFHEWGQSIEPFEYLLEKFSKPGDLVFEPCSGGGTTALACLKKGRRCIAIDNEHAAYQSTLYRLEQHRSSSVGLTDAEPLAA